LEWDYDADDWNQIKEEAMGESDERRMADRLELQFPIQGRVGKGEFLDLEVVDISLGGM
jgi:hypothetical protein